jgi:hypothetical protein
MPRLPIDEQITRLEHGLDQLHALARDMLRTIGRQADDLAELNRTLAEPPEITPEPQPTADAWTAAHNPADRRRRRQQHDGTA